jgi:hypothetical protein
MCPERKGKIADQTAQVFGVIDGKVFDLKRFSFLPVALIGSL